MNRSTIVTLGALVVILIIAALFTYAALERREQRALDTSSAGLALSTSKSATFTDLTGAPVDLRSFDGRVRVVNSWASWCPYCQQELKDFTALADEYTDRGVAVIAINRAEPATTVEAYLRTISTGNNLVLILDPNDAFYESVGGFAMPETVFYDTEGNIVKQQRGVMTLEEMRAQLEHVLTNAREQ